MDDIVVRFSDVWEMYRVKFVKDRKVNWEDFWALKNVDFSVRKGESLCLMGENGAGKTTTLKLIAGMIVPDRGKVDVKGRVSALMELGAGFHPEVTGRENIFLNAGLYGLSEKEMETKIDEIVEFAEIGKFIDAPIKHYSQGMYMRLGFSLAIHVDPNILLIDDILAVGDALFQTRCIKKIFELKRKGMTLVFITHDISVANMLCERGIFLEKGEIIKKGAIEEITAFYQKSVDFFKRKIVEARDKLTEDIEGEKHFPKSIKQDGLELFCCKEKVKLYWNGNEITQKYGIWTKFTCLDKVYDSLQATWEIKKDNNKIAIRLRWSNLPVIQVWEFNVDKNYVSLCVDMEVIEKVDIWNREIGIVLSGQYQEWFTLDKNGKFMGLSGDEGVKVGFFKNQKDYLIGVKKYKDLPEVSFIQAILNSDWVSRFQNRQIDDIVIAELCYAHVNKKNMIQFLPGKYKYFRGKIYIGEKTIIKSRTKEKLFKKKKSSQLMVKKSALNVRFESGKGKLFWKDIELTSGLGIYTSVLSGKWCDSSQARWEIVRKKNKIIATGYWTSLPICQLWEIKLKDARTIIWKVTMEVFKRVKIDREQVNLMLSSKYRKWMVPGEAQGKFPDKFNDYGNLFWDRMWSGNSKGIFLEVESVNKKGGFLPGVSLKLLKRDATYQAIIENTNPLFSARILQFQKLNLGRLNSLKPGKYIYFKGVIKIKDEKIFT